MYDPNNPNNRNIVQKSDKIEDDENEKHLPRLMINTYLPVSFKGLFLKAKMRDLNSLTIIPIVLSLSTFPLSNDILLIISKIISIDKIISHVTYLSKHYPCFLIKWGETALEILPFINAYWKDQLYSIQLFNHSHLSQCAGIFYDNLILLSAHLEVDSLS